MIKIQLIGVKTLKDRSILQQNTDEKTLNLAIREFQELELKDTLGTSEYNRIQDEVYKVKIGTQEALTPADVELMLYITDLMVYGSLMYSISPLHQKQTNKGTQVDRDLNAEVGSPGAARADYAFKMEGYKRALIKFIQQRDKDLAVNPSKCESVQDTTAQFTGMFLPDEMGDLEQQVKNEYYKSKGWRRSL